MTYLEVEAIDDARVQLERDLDSVRIELRAYCYRMLGSAFDAEDAVQESLVRAWRHIDRFEGRASLRSWLYRIATNVCLDLIAARQRRALPVDLNGPGRPHDPLGDELAAHEWVEPIADRWVVRADVDPAERAVVRDSVRLAFVAALQVLPARQRAAVILRDVLSWRPHEIADLLGTTVVSVNSSLQRARQTLAAMDGGQRSSAGRSDEVTERLLQRYVDAFESYDVDALVALLHEDATWMMPPFPLWFRGAADIGAWFASKPEGCRSVRLVPLELNGSAGFALYRPSKSGGYFEAFAVQVLDLRDGVITAVDTFLDPRLVTLFGGSAALAT
jgi:RNA polymerase sigma-70 factor (ECF subfamily)